MSLVETEIKQTVGELCGRSSGLRTLVRYSLGMAGNRVIHCEAFSALEEEMLALGSEGGPSPDRADALVWGITRLMLEARSAGPRVRGL